MQCLKLTINVKEQRTELKQLSYTSCKMCKNKVTNSLEIYSYSSRNMNTSQASPKKVTRHGLKRNS